MRTLVVVFLFIGIPLAGGTLPSLRDVDYWRESGLSADQTRALLTTKICNETPEQFGACVFAFRAAGEDLSNLNYDQKTPFDFNKSFDTLIAKLEKTPAEPLPQTLQKMINAEIHFFDPHAKLIPRALFADRYMHADSMTYGIGIDYEITGAGTFIRRIYAGSPAERAGLKVNDQIKMVGGRGVRFGVAAIYALERLSEPGAEFEMRVWRGNEDLTITLKAERLQLPGVIADPINWPGMRNKANFLHLIVRNFAAGICDEVERAVSAQAYAEVVLDLRNNPGGNLDEANCVNSLFSTSTDFVSKKPLKTSLLPSSLPLLRNFDANDQEAWRAHRKQSKFSKMKLIVLVNAESASAAEMLAAALQDHERAWVIGEPTFGKGSTQEQTLQAFNAELQLIYTVSRYYRPNGDPLQLFGVTPNFLIPFRRGANFLERLVPREGEWFGQRLEREDRAAWSEPHPRLIEDQMACVHAGGFDQRARNWLDKNRGTSDEQLGFALALSACAPTSNPLPTP